MIITRLSTPTLITEPVVVRGLVLPVRNSADPSLLRRYRDSVAARLSEGNCRITATQADKPEGES